MIGITDLPLKIIAFYKHVSTYVHACGHMTYNCFVEIPTGAMAGHDSVHVSEHITLKKYGGMHGPENFHHLKTNKKNALIYFCGFGIYPLFILTPGTCVS